MTLSRKWIPWVVRLAIALAILYFIFTIIPFSEVVAAISTADGTWVLIAFLLLVPERFSGALRNQILSAQVGISLSVWRIWEINTATAFYSTFLPGDLAGGAVRWYKMSQPDKKPAQAFAAITFDRVIDTIGLAILGLVFWLIDVPRVTSTAVGLLFAVFSIGLLVGLGMSLSRTVATMALRLLEHERLPGAVSFLREKFRKVVESVQMFRELPPRVIASLTVLTLVRHLLSLAILYCFALSLRIDVGIASLGWVRSLMNLITMVPISFSGLGVREASLMVLLEPYGVSGTGAVALSFMTFIMHLSLAAAGAILEAARTFGLGLRSSRGSTGGFSQEN
jgi:uncharacterized protein (TIRG00374 family)